MEALMQKSIGILPINLFKLKSETKSFNKIYFAARDVISKTLNYSMNYFFCWISNLPAGLKSFNFKSSEYRV